MSLKEKGIKIDNNLELDVKPAGFWRRILAACYDIVLVVAIEMCAGAIALGVVVLAVKMQLISIHGYLDVSDYMNHQPIIVAIYRFYLVAIWLFFYSYFWHKAGQTIGMKAWRLRIQNADHSQISWLQTLKRSTFALLGLGNLLVLFHPQKKALQDLVAHCDVVYYSKVKNKVNK